MPALILDADLKSALASIRSLGRQGIPVIAGAERRTAMGLHSRYVQDTFVYPSPVADRADFLEAVRRASAGAGPPPVLFTFSDATFLPVFEQWPSLAPVASAVLPAAASVAVAFDKAQTLRLAERLGIAIPRTEFFEHLSDLKFVRSDLTFPVVVKPRRSASWRREAGRRNRVLFAFSADEMRRIAAALTRQTGEPPLIQEYLRGEELGVEFLCRDGHAVASCAHRRLRSLAPSGGAAVVKQTIGEEYKGIGDAARRMMAELGWSGPAMVEFKVDERDGEAKLLEINGRFWGSLPLAVKAGVDFPGAYYRMARGEEPEAGTCRQGMISRHWLGDLSNLLAVLFDRGPLRPLVYPKRTRALTDFFLRSRFPSDVSDSADRWPAAWELVDAAAKRL